MNGNVIDFFPLLLFIPAFQTWPNSKKRNGVTTSSFHPSKQCLVRFGIIAGIALIF